MSLYLGIYYITKQEKTPNILCVGHDKRNRSFLWLVNSLYIILLFGSLPRVAAPLTIYLLGSLFEPQTFDN